MTPRIVSFRPTERVEDIFEDANLVTVERKRYNDEKLAQLVNGADALYVYAENEFSEAIMDVAPSLKVIGKPGSGIDNIDVTAATDREIAVVHTPGMNAEAVAEFTVALVLNWLRLIPEAISHMRAGNWRWETAPWEGNDLKGKTVGLVGLGAAGRATARRLGSFDVDLLAADPYVDSQMAADVGASLVELDELLTQSDVVSLHVRLTAETRDLIGHEELAAMKDSALLVNTSRGEVVDEQRLIDALEAKRIAGAALDVYNDEPPNPTNPLFDMDNVIPTPHIAGMAYETRSEVMRVTARNVMRILRGEPVEKQYLANQVS